MALYIDSHTFEIPCYEAIQWAIDYPAHDAPHPEDQELYIRGATAAREEYKREETGSIAGWRSLEHVELEQHVLYELDCERCARSFANSYALQQHLRNSPAYWRYPGCDFDHSDRSHFWLKVRTKTVTVTRREQIHHVIEFMTFQQRSMAVGDYSYLLV